MLNRRMRSLGRDVERRREKELSRWRKQVKRGCLSKGRREKERKGVGRGVVYGHMRKKTNTASEMIL